jgi:fermentation-respiration switch protein FrsA (DUF1100 family)
MMTSSTLTGNSTGSSLLNNFLFRFLYKIGTVGTGLIAIVAGLLYAKQESLLYFPEINGIPRRPGSNPRQYRSPSEYNIPFTSHMIKCPDNISIHAWLLLQEHNKPSSSPTIIFFHGNAGNIGLRLPNAAKMYHELGCNVFMVEYRGYGDSDDVKPNEKGLKLDSEAAYNYLLTQSSSMDINVNIDPNNIYIFGRSLGGAVAFHLANYAEKVIQKPVRGIIVENTFTSISKMVDQLMPMIAPLKFLVLRMDWNSEWIAPTLQTPILYLAGEKDELVPHSQMRDLYRKSKQRSLYAKMHIIRGGTHNESWVQGGREYFQSIKSFMSHVILHHGQGLLNKGSSVNNGTGSTTATTATDRSNSGSCSSFEETTTTSVEVTMGGEKVDTNNPMGGAIPIMPKNIIGMAKEATKSLTNTEKASDRKKES